MQELAQYESFMRGLPESLEEFSKDTQNKIPKKLLEISDKGIRSSKAPHNLPTLIFGISKYLSKNLYGDVDGVNSANAIYVHFSNGLGKIQHLRDAENLTKSLVEEYGLDYSTAGDISYALLLGHLICRNRARTGGGRLNNHQKDFMLSWTQKFLEEKGVSIKTKNFMREIPYMSFAYAKPGQKI